MSHCVLLSIHKSWVKRAERTAAIDILNIIQKIRDTGIHLKVDCRSRCAKHTDQQNDTIVVLTRRSLLLFSRSRSGMRAPTHTYTQTHRRISCEVFLEKGKAYTASVVCLSGRDDDVRLTGSVPGSSLPAASLGFVLTVYSARRLQVRFGGNGHLASIRSGFVFRPFFLTINELSGAGCERLAFFVRELCVL